MASSLAQPGLLVAGPDPQESAMMTAMLAVCIDDIISTSRSTILIYSWIHLKEQGSTCKMSDTWLKSRLDCQSLWRTDRYSICWLAAYTMKYIFNIDREAVLQDKCQNPLLSTLWLSSCKQETFPLGMYKERC